MAVSYINRCSGEGWFAGRGSGNPRKEAASAAFLRGLPVDWQTLKSGTAGGRQSRPVPVPLGNWMLANPERSAAVTSLRWMTSYEQGL